MDEFFNNTKFLNIMNKLPYEKDRILDIMKEIKEKKPELTIDVFICILYRKLISNQMFVNNGFFFKETL